ncbi:MAG: hypothetical protein QME62_06365 [Armatimonadota bacterium]|nr:hypothetical protein [Armatimonadota bacterium]
MADLATMIGTPSRLTIYDDAGHIIVKEGEIITYGVIEAARAAGKLDDLRMSAAMAHQEPTIETAASYEEIGEEEPTGVHPE